MTVISFFLKPTRRIEVAIHNERRVTRRWGAKKESVERDWKREESRPIPTAKRTQPETIKNRRSPFDMDDLSLYLIRIYATGVIISRRRADHNFKFSELAFYPYFMQH
ncbi:MAG TPA: hypothetical protein VIK48_03970 [Candidatus Manganitrophaceae bacterium]